MKKTEVSVNIHEFPSRLHWLFDDTKVFDSSCSSGARVLCLDSGYYLKIDEKGRLAEEAVRSRFFADLGLGVEVVDYLSDDRDYLLTRMADGEDMTHYLSAPEKLCRVLADSLRMLHSRPAEGISLSPRQQRYLDSAAAGEGCYDESVRMKRFPVGTKEEAWDIMQRSQHCLKADTLIHGDACLPNIIIKDGEFSTFIDFSLSGVGDRHIDIYWALWSLQFNLGTEGYTDFFWTAMEEKIWIWRC